MTLPAHTTLLTGLEPPSHGVRVNGRHRLPDGVPTIAETLRGKGYRTGAFVAAYVLDRRFGLDRGFEVYDDDLRDARPQAVAEKLSVYRGADTSLRRPRRADERSGAPFRVGHFYDPDYPTETPASQARSSPASHHDGEVVHGPADRRLLDLPGCGRRAEDAVVADHAKGAAITGARARLSPERGILRVPLLVRWPGRAPAPSCPAGASAG
jgi:arylsulfatase A-like enzyme